MRNYAGIGSRQTPSDILTVMTDLAVRLYKEGYTLRSGGADGADTAFEEGCTKMHKAYLDDSENVYGSLYPQMEIYLPWPNFNQKQGVGTIVIDCNSPNWTIAKSLVLSIHPNFNALSNAAMKLHIRNCYQILGKNLVDPVDFVICYTDPEYKRGGTRTAVLLAKKYDVPIYNLAIPEVLNSIHDIVGKYDSKTTTG